ncbi:hypothetical protein FJTKL_02659 [Diaporthe vaccinii]|uniref:Uncharacterized protein n=1 Tax=Diaporthe vaccinii TaxID=105482 RepID=A0ABR4DXM9_9PEZI
MLTSKRASRLEHKGGTLGLLVTTQLEVLASLQGQLQLGLARGALETQHNLLRGLGLLVEDRLRLTTVTRLLAVIGIVSIRVPRGPRAQVRSGHRLRCQEGLVVGVGGTYRS